MQEKQPTVLVTDNSRVLMSDVLKGNVPEIEDAQSLEKASMQAVFVIADRQFNGKSNPMSGILRTILFDKEPEIEFVTQLDDALMTVSTEGLAFGGFELQHGETSIPFTAGEDPKGKWYFGVRAIRILDIDIMRQTCVLALSLKRVSQ